MVERNIDETDACFVIFVGTARWPLLPVLGRTELKKLAMALVMVALRGGMLFKSRKIRLELTGKTWAGKKLSNNGRTYFSFLKLLAPDSLDVVC